MRILLLCLLLAACGGSSGPDEPVPPPRCSASHQPCPTSDVVPGGLSFELTQVKANPQGITRGATDPYCWWAGASATANVSVWFSYAHRPIRYAWWVATGLPNGGGWRLVAHDYDEAGVFQMEVLAEYLGDETSPVPRGGWVQDQMNAIILASSPSRVYRYIGVQVCGAARLYSSSVYIATE